MMPSLFLFWFKLLISFPLASPFTDNEKLFFLDYVPRRLHLAPLGKGDAEGVLLLLS